MPEAGLAGEAVTLGAGPGGSVLSSSRTCALLLVLSSGLLLVEDDVRALGAGLLGRIGLLARDALLDRGLVKRLLVLHLDSGLAALGGRLLTDLPLTGGRGGARGVGSSESLREDTSVLAGRRPCCAEPDARRAHTGCAGVGRDRQDGGQEGRGPTCAGTGGGTALGTGRSGRDEPVLLAELPQPRDGPPDRQKALQGVSGALGQFAPGQTAYERYEGLLAAVLGQAERGDLDAVRAALRRRRVQAARAVPATRRGEWLRALRSPPSRASRYRPWDFVRLVSLEVTTTARSQNSLSR